MNIKSIDLENNTKYRTIRYIIFEDENVYIAQGIDVDICTHHMKLSEVMNRFLRTVVANLKACRTEYDISTFPVAPINIYNQWYLTDTTRLLLNVEISYDKEGNIIDVVANQQ